MFSNMFSGGRFFRISRRLAPVALAVLATSGMTDPGVAAVPTTNVFPVQGHDASDCSDSFGDPRSDGRTHQGNDCFAPTGTPVLAVESGVVSAADNTNSHTCGSTSGDLGGITLWLTGDSGTAYYYAHHYRNAVTVAGTRVARGQVIAYVGTTGNACSTSPHLHFEIHPGGRGSPAIDPYPYLRQWTTSGTPPALPRRPLCNPVTGDWDGDGDSTLGMACKNGHGMSWSLMNINAGGSPQIVGGYGNSDYCVPITGDWDGNGTVTVGNACRNGHGMAFSLINGYSGSPSYPVFGFGNSDYCWPVTGDWDGNGTDTIGVACKSGHGLTWSLMNGHTGGTPQITGGYGNSDYCRPITGDWNGDGRDTIGVACKNGTGISWSLINGFSGSPSYPVFGFGNSDLCRPVTGDWNNDRIDTIGVACKNGHGVTWSMMNFHSGGTPQITAGYGNSDTYQPTGGWAGPAWPNWPTSF